MTTSVLYVEDVSFDRLVFERHFASMNRSDIQLVCAASVEAALEIIATKMPKILFLDACVPPFASAHEMLPVFVDAGFRGAVVLVTGLPTSELEDLVNGPGAVCGLLDKRTLSAGSLTEVITPLLAPLANG